ncbi:hypothetical protein DMENIID0001_142550 [Sergentomyia squamirostris]
MNMSLKNEILSFHCVLQDDCKMEDAQDLLSCADHIKDHLNISVELKWIREEECLSIDTNTLSKTNIFIFQKFSGHAFQYLTTKSKALVIGRPCLEYCLTQDTLVPLTRPIYTVAMDKMVITASGMSKPEKKEIEELVFWMGGYFTEDLDCTCTHLVATTVRSKKYEQASISGLEIMHPNWVKDVWEENKEETVLASDAVFHHHRLPIFANLTITSTGLNSKEKEDIIRLIVNNGGKYLREFKTKSVNILILKQSGIFSEKYKNSIRNKIDCLSPDWIHESVKMKYAVPIDHYRIVSEMHSTPIEDKERGRHFSLMSTDISRISSATVTSDCEINETKQSITTRSSTSSKPNQEDLSYRDMMKNFNLTKTKESGAFLDGCNIYLVGFTCREAQKLNKVISNAGATIYTDPADNITHAVVGNATGDDLNELHERGIQCKVVKFSWLLECQKVKQPVDEEPHLVATKKIRTEAEAPSPASKKSIQAMNNSFKKPQIPRKRLDLGEPSTSVVQKYLPSATDVSANGAYDLTHDNYNTDVDPSEHEVLTFFQNLIFFLYGYHEDYCQEQLDVEQFGGTLVDATFTGTVDYILLPIDGVEKIDPPVKGKNIVNDLWLEDCVTNRSVVSIEFYHKPIIIEEPKDLLQGVYLTFSNYSGNLKLYLVAMAGVLGAMMLDDYPKSKTPLLICSKPEGSKYAAAMKWKYPVVTKDWLMDTFKEKRVKKIQNYLLGRAVVSTGIEIFEKLNQDELPSSSEARPQPEVRRTENAFLGDVTTEENSCNQSHHTSLKRKSDNMYVDDEDEEENVTIQGTKSIPSAYKGIKTPVRHKRLALLALDTPTNKKTPDTPITSELKKNYADLETPIRNCLRESAMQNINIDEYRKADGTIRTPSTPADLRMPTTPLDPDPNATPGAQWSRLRSIEACDSLCIPTAGAKKKSTPQSEVRRQFYKTLYDEEKYKKMMCTFSQSQSNTEESQVQPPVKEVIIPESARTLNDYIMRNANRTQTPKRNLLYVENPEPSYEFPPIEPQLSEGLVGWVDPSEYVPIRNPDDFPPKLYNFHFAAVPESKRQELTTKIESLGGKVLFTDSYDETCTHLMYQHLNRGEKVLGAVAAGKWLVPIKYIEDSVKIGYFLPEEDYEAGNEQLPYLSQLNESECMVAKAAFRWRLKINGLLSGEESIDGPFSDMNFLLLLADDKNDGIIRTIKAGKGTVFDLKPPFCRKTDAKSITHVLLNPKKEKLSKVDSDFFNKTKAHVVSIKYLSDVLFSETLPDPRKYHVF